MYCIEPGVCYTFFRNCQSLLRIDCPHVVRSEQVMFNFPFYCILICMHYIASVTRAQYWQLLAHDSIYAIAHICYRPSVWLSGRLSGRPSHGWISQKRLKLGSFNLHHRVAPMPHDSSFPMPNFAAKFQREHRERARQIRQGYEKYTIFSQ